jgi:hypothetical protein
MLDLPGGSNIRGLWTASEPSQVPTVLGIEEQELPSQNSDYIENAHRHLKEAEFRTIYYHGLKEATSLPCSGARTPFMTGFIAEWLKVRWPRYSRSRNGANLRVPEGSCSLRTAVGGDFLMILESPSPMSSPMIAGTLFMCDLAVLWRPGHT